jgi:1-deoxy-D-xylulose-5-phosphate reductoisomerase
MKSIAILGSTGSIGQNALAVIRNLPGKFKVVGLSTHSNIEILLKQIREFHPLFCCVTDTSSSKKIKPYLKPHIKLFVGESGLEEMTQQSEIKKILLAISGTSALIPLLKAIDTNKEIALANKEALVTAGPIIMNLVTQKKIKLIPVDSELSAIWQCLDGKEPSRLKKIYLTASGGPFWKLRKKSLRDVSINEVLRHPRWKMGKKISVDSANLMNKGLELLETMFLFGIPYDKIKILIHPQALVHSMVEFIDGIILAQLSITDMRIPIQYALTYPQRLSSSLPGINFYRLNGLNFEEPDFKRFPCLKLAYRVARTPGTMPAALNAANEVCVEEFLKKRLKFISIPKVIERVLDSHRNHKNPDLQDILGADAWARSQAYKVIENLN